jgi:DNA repair exonuclease SbcCD ATPase subunit
VGVNKEIDNLIELKAKTGATKNPYSSMVTDFTAKIYEKEKEEVLGKSELARLGTEVEIACAVEKVFSPAGVRARILDEVTPFLNDQTAKYLASLTDGNTTATWSTLVKNAKGEFREKFSIEVEDATGGKSFAALSGGEKRKVRIAAALALQDLVATRASKPIELFIGDEIDDALDQAGLERLTGILEEKARERGSVFIISHNDLKDWVPTTITVTKKDGKSVVIDGV